MVLMRRALSLVLALWAGLAQADADRLEAAWRGWVAQTGIAESSLAIVRDGEVVRSLGIGMAARDRAPLASLSKSITGACIMELEARGLLTTGQTVGEILGRTWLDMTPGAAEITVAELLTHSSGLMQDSTQGRPRPWSARGGDRTVQVTQTALLRDPGAKRFFYNNENYAVLGAVIAVVTRRDVHDVCPELLGIDARVNASFGGGVAWGGFEMSAPDFARFAARLTPRRDWPTTPMGGGVRYGPGVMLSEAGRGAVWHFGSWCFVLGRSTGAYFFQIRDGWGATVTYNRCLTDDQTRALDAVLAAAVR
jgi:CubicO group peptidase (beta-lactamase class C family)